MNLRRSRRRILAGLLAAGLLYGSPYAARASESNAASDPRKHAAASPAELLLLAREDMEAGQTGRARETLARVSREHPLVADYADLFLAESLLAEGDFDAAQRYLAAASQRHARSPLRSVFQKHTGAALREQGDDQGAREAWLAALARSRLPRSEQAELWAEIARSHLREEDMDHAWVAYMEIWRRFPEQAEAAREASDWLDAREAAKGQQRTGANWRDRADQLFHNREFEAALQTYDRALAMDPSPEDQRILQKRRADVLFRLKRYSEAERIYARHGGSLVIAHSRALSLARSGRVSEGIDLLLALAKRRGMRAPKSRRAKYTAALLLKGEGRDEEARELFEGIAQETSRHPLRYSALWHLGWSDYLAGRYEEAARQLGELAEIESNELTALRPRYWRARALENLGDPQAASQLRTLAEEFPLSYYGWRAQKRTGRTGIATRPVVADATEPAATSTSGNLDRIRILLEADLQEAAIAELQRSLPGRGGAISDRTAHAALSQAAGHYHLAQASALRGNGEVLARGPQRHAEDMWWHAWPRAYASEVDVAVGRVHGRVAPELVFAIIREESGYRPEVVSSVGARGLMQIMEPTGQELASARGMDPIDASDLFDPALNIELGTQYLADLGEAFPEHPAAAIASYNAGPHVVAKWDGLEKLEEDEWVETIPYDQTQKYVKRVLRSQSAYGSLYGNE